MNWISAIRFFSVFEITETLYFPALFLPNGGIIKFKLVLTVIIFVSIFSGCISQPTPPETSVPTLIPTATTIVEDRQQAYGRTSASIYLESNAENITIYVPVLLDENKNVLKMYDTPLITGNATTAIVDTEHGKALMISKSGHNEIYFQDRNEKLKEGEQTPEQKSDEFFSRFTISMSNYKVPAHFVSMAPDPNIDAWVYSDSDIEKVSFSYGIDPQTTLYKSEMGSSGIALGISPQGSWVHLRKGWQVVKLSQGKIAWDAVSTPTP